MKLNGNSFKRGCLAFILTAGMTASAAASSLSVTPGEFDFGWAPDNAKISCEFTVRNEGGGLMALTAVKPACGCTASEFTPSTLESRQETSVRLTFNTRGYTGRDFNKTVDVEAAGGTEVVRLKGHVTNPAAQLAPEGDGIAGFDGKNGRRKTIRLKNHSSEALELVVVQAPHEWAKASLGSTTLPAGGTAEVEISVSGSLETDRNTSVTIEGRGKEASPRATIAIWTGRGPKALRKAPVSSQPKAPAPGKTEKPKAVPGKK